MAKNCDHSDFTLIREMEVCINGDTYNIEVSRCKDCGEVLYGYDGWINPKWESTADVKAYLRSL